MPELPEVETVKENLKKRLINKKINDVKVLYNNIIAYPDTNTFEKILKNRTVKTEKRTNNTFFIDNLTFLYFRQIVFFLKFKISKIFYYRILYKTIKIKSILIFLSHF